MKVCLLEEGCESGLNSMSFHPLHHQCDDSKKLRTILFLDAAFYEYFNVVHQIVYSRSSMSIASRMPETSSAPKLFFNGLERHEIGVFVTALPPVETNLMPPL